jgi:hypothetical protein
VSILINILAIITLSYTFRNLDGPFGLFNFIRNKLLTNSYVGVFFYQLLNCAWCFGFHCGYVIYLLQTHSFSIREFILWGLAGSAISALFEIIYNSHSNE